MRHAEAEEEAESGGDEARRLTVRGRERTRDAAGGLRALGLRFDAILTSSLLRAAETAELVADEYANNPPPQVLPALSPDVTPREALVALTPFARHSEVLVVGHEPQLSRLVGLLLSSNGNVAIRFRKGACVALDLPKTIEPGAGELRWMLTQRQLRKLRKS
ncbi:MAG: histidine phosphatase family protein [Deltaproteobacteria bacterium]|nr:histidine phosphatase family protein [Deltaproteobacteria bacterium]